MVSLGHLRSCLTQLLHLRESVHRTALAFAIGVFIAFSPTYGLHTLSAILCAWAFRLNFMAVMAGSLVNNPWTVVPILGATVWTGFTLTGAPHVPSFDWNHLGWWALYEQISPYLIPFFIGGFALSILGALLAYPAAYLLITHYRTRYSQPTDPRLPHESS